MGMGTSDGTAEFARVEGSDRQPLPDAERIGGIDRKRQMDVTVVMRRKSGAAVRAATPPAPGDDIAGWRRDLRQRPATEAGADTTELDAVTSYLTSRGLSIEAADAGQRRIVVRGDVDQMEAAFNVELDLYQAGDIRYRGREGHVHLPPDIADYVEAVLGLDDRPQARIHMKRGDAMDEAVLPHPRENPMTRLQARAEATPSPAPLWPMQVAQMYDFPTGVDGTGQTIAIIELDGGFRDTDLDTYFSQAGLRRPDVIAIPVDANTPGISDADGEVMLDIEVSAAIAPGSRIVVYFGTDPDSGFYDAVSAAIHDDTNSPSTISISWGAPENGWTEQGMRVFDKLFEDAAALGITVLVAAGDHGAGDAAMDDQQHADFPASSPNAIACGGTTLIAEPDEKIASEVVWNDGDGWATGGGFSRTFPRPDWQAAIASTEDVGGRGVPDVARQCRHHVGLHRAGERALGTDRGHERCGAALRRALRPDGRAARASADRDAPGALHRAGDDVYGHHGWQQQHARHGGLRPGCHGVLRGHGMGCVYRARQHRGHGAHDVSPDAAGDDRSEDSLSGPTP